MKVDHIITLDNNIKYLLLDETILENKKYFYAVEVKGENEEVTNNYLFLEESYDSANVYVTVVNDKKIKLELLKIFKDKIFDSVNKE